MFRPPTTPSVARIVSCSLSPVPCLMSDQSKLEIHRLVARASGPAPRREQSHVTLVISGGRPGVGATTLAVNLASALAKDAHRVVLIDADLYRADVASQCNL